jgi:hypothetical protein
VRLTLQLHPERAVGDGTVLDALAAGGTYLSQFSTGTSNGGLTAHRGGARWRWESRLFDGRYDAGPASARPVYGAWDRHGDPWGGAVRFGSSYLVLSADCVARSTYCFPDSSREPDLVGGPEALPALCAAADAACDGTEPADPLDDYVEAQVHGPVLVERDVVEVVLDPCFADGPVHHAALRLGPAVRFHPGFRVGTADLDAVYRGRAALELARALGPVLTPLVVGAAAADHRHDPQLVKQVWHLLARFGRVAPGVTGR